MNIAIDMNQPFKVTMLRNGKVIYVKDGTVIPVSMTYEICGWRDALKLLFGFKHTLTMRMELRPGYGIHKEEESA